MCSIGFLSLFTVVRTGFLIQGWLACLAWSKEARKAEAKAAAVAHAQVAEAASKLDELERIKVGKKKQRICSWFRRW
jgi:hypothetical protein